MSKLDWLRKQATAYWTDAENQSDEREAQRLLSLAIRCQEQILEIEHGIVLQPSSASVY
jgi:hypothetical protein